MTRNLLRLSRVDKPPSLLREWPATRAFALLGQGCREMRGPPEILAAIRWHDLDRHGGVSVGVRVVFVDRKPVIERMLTPWRGMVPGGLRQICELTREALRKTHRDVGGVAPNVTAMMLFPAPGDAQWRAEDFTKATARHRESRLLQRWTANPKMTIPY